MKFLFPLSALLSAMLLFMYLPLFAHYCNTVDMDFEQLRLDKALEFSTRAATSNGLQHGLVTFDRNELEEAEFNTGVVLDTYAQFMCFNYNLIPTERTKENILSSSVLMAIGGRGYTVTQNEYGFYYQGVNGQVRRSKGAVDPTVKPYVVSSNTGTRTLFGVYTPFVIEDGSPPFNQERFVSGSLLPNAKSFAVMLRDKGTNTAYIYSADALPGDVTPARVQHEALAQMSRAFTQAWQQLNIKEVSNQRLTMPNTITNFGVSSAANPGVMALIEGFNIGTFKPLRSSAFTGYKAVVRREVVTFTQVINGVTAHWYSYRDQVDMDKALSGTGAYAGVTVDYVYPDMQEAATAKIVGCLEHVKKCTCVDAENNPTPAHCHYQPHMGFILK